MIVTVANRKGGVGKTTTAVFVAHALAVATARPCLLVDADPQGSASLWARRAADAGTPLPVTVREHLPMRPQSLVSTTQHVVIDTPPSDSHVVTAAVELADIVLIPTSPSTMDLSVLGATLELAARAGKPAAVLLTQTRRTRSVSAAESTLLASGTHLLRTHVALREALATAFGRPVRQLHGYDLATAELLGELPEQPYSVEAVQARVARPQALQPLITRAHVVQRPTGFDDDELIARLKTSVARLLH
ncbi:MAG TPA: ParA family protein [Jatrophihabitans sp.]|jgi:chromosome partitioning protein